MIRLSPASFRIFTPLKELTSLKDVDLKPIPQQSKTNQMNAILIRTQLNGNRILFLLYFMLVAGVLRGQGWQPDAGLNRPWKAKLSASSGIDLQAVADENPENYWQSDNPLPFHYISVTGQNYFLEGHPFQMMIPNTEADAAAFDGNQNTKVNVESGSLKLVLNHPVALKILTLKAENNDTISIVVHYSDGSGRRLLYTPIQKFQLQNYPLGEHGKVAMVELKSKMPFGLFELAALKDLPTEYVQLDFEKVRKIGWIASRHLNAEGVKSIGVFTSIDGERWVHLLDLDPQAIPFLQIPLNRLASGRYVRVVFTLKMVDYKKAVLWEFAVYGKYGPYGRPPAAKVSDNDFEHAFGINTIWGWGYSVYSDRLKQGTGPAQFRSLTSQLRTYHRLDWDIRTPEQLPDYDAMAKGKGTLANSWLNWDKEYEYWQSLGYQIDASIMFKEPNFPDSLWKRPYDEAFAFGKRFGQHFGSGEKPLLARVEIGNEPWNYKKSVYQQLLAGMSLGIHSVSDMKVITCAIQAFAPNHESGNYIADYLTEENSRWIDGLNTHIYSYVYRKDGKRVAVMPEDRRSEVWSMANLVRYRDANLPGKTIDVTEFGFDASGGGEDCTHGECVSEIQQAVFGVRMAMLLWRLGASHFYWYFFANVDYSSFLHNRSGLCSSYRTGFQKKLAFMAFEKMQRLLGPYHFYKVLREDDEVYAYWFKNFKNGKQILMVWRPVKDVVVSPRWISLPISGQVIKIIPLIDGVKSPYDASSGTFKIKLSGSPVFIEF
jgi:serine/threonine-protein kinase ATR